MAMHRASEAGCRKAGGTKLWVQQQQHSLPGGGAAVFGTASPQRAHHAAQHHRRSCWRRSVYPTPPLNPYDDKYEFSLTQYMVTLDKPIGVTLAPDPLTGQVYVQAIQEGLAAAESQMMRVGDQLLLVSAATTVLGDDMWPATDLARTRWAINNRVGKVKLVLERSPASMDDDSIDLLPPWYFKGREGVNTWQVPELQLPVRFDTDVGGELADSTPGVGRILSVSFNRCLAPQAPEQARVLRAGVLARHARADALLSQLHEAAAAPEVDYVNPVILQLAAMDPQRFQVGVPGTQPSPAPGSQNVLPFRRPSNNSNSNSRGAGGANSNSNNTGAPADGAAADQQQQPPQGNGGNSNNNTQPPPPQAQQQQQGLQGQQQMPPPLPQQQQEDQQQQQQQQMPLPPQQGGPQQQQQQQMGPGLSGPWWPPDSIAIPVTAYRQTRLVQVLPWLMASTGPLLPADLAQLATSRALSCLLEMRLSVTSDGLLCSRGQPPPPFTLPQEHGPPVLNPSDSPEPAPQQPPPLQAAPDAEQQQQQPAAGAAMLPQQDEQQQQAAVAVQQQQHDAFAVAASMAGVAGPDMGFASAAVAAAAAAAATEQQEQQLQEAAAAAEAATTNGNAAAAAGAPPPLHATLQAHAILHCLSDLQRLAVRRQWRDNNSNARLTSSAGNVYSGSYNGYNTGYDSSSPTASLNVQDPAGSAAAGAAAGGGGAASAMGPFTAASRQRGFARQGAFGQGSAAAGAAAGAGGSRSQQQQRGAGAGQGQGSMGAAGGNDAAAVGMGLSSRQLLLQCEGRAAWQQAGVLLAAWLHWCGGVDQAAAVDSVSSTLGITIDKVVLSEVRRLLLVRAKERFSRRILSWPYGGVTAEVSGDLVGGWTERVPMTRCTNPDGCLGASKGHFYLELKGLAPGRYHYKYIIDNTWAVDGLAPKVLDSEGNWNNVLEVSAPPRIETPEEQAHYAALQAMWSAFEHKMHFLRGGHHSMNH